MKNIFGLASGIPSSLVVHIKRYECLVGSQNDTAAKDLPKQAFSAAALSTIGDSANEQR